MQFESPKDIPDINYEIVIVGSGPAGISIANALERSNKKILILEPEQKLCCKKVIFKKK